MATGSASSAATPSGTSCAATASAERLLRGLAATVPGREELFLEVPGPNAEAMALARGLGLSTRFETARMYKGQAPALPLGDIFGSTTFELG